MLIELENIPELRSKLGLTQAQLCSKVGIKQPYLSMIESGKRNPSYCVLKKISELLTSKKFLRFVEAQTNSNIVLSVIEEHEVIHNREMFRYVTVEDGRHFIIATGRRIEEQK